jgi:hypothetical protein
MHGKVSRCACYKQEYNFERRDKVSSNSLNSRQEKNKQKARTEEKQDEIGAVLGQLKYINLRSKRVYRITIKCKTKLAHGFYETEVKQ